MDRQQLVMQVMAVNKINKIIANCGKQYVLKKNIMICNCNNGDLTLRFSEFNNHKILDEIVLFAVFRCNNCTRLHYMRVLSQKTHDMLAQETIDIFMDQVREHAEELVLFNF